MDTSGEDDEEVKARVRQMILAEKKRRFCCSRAVRIVEQYSSEHVTRHYLSETLNLIERSHWDDAIDERNGEGFCGYVFCTSRPLMDEGKRQQYRICSRTNRVYDMAEYNRFCSVKCYNRSNYIKEQIPETLMTSRDESKFIEVELLEDKATGKNNEPLIDGQDSFSADKKCSVLVNETKLVDPEESSNQSRPHRRQKRVPFSYSKTNKVDESEQSPLMDAKNALKSWITSDTIKWLNDDLPAASSVNEHDEAYMKKVENFYGRRLRKKEDEKEEEKGDLGSDADLIHIPLVDSISQDSIRKRIVIEKIGPSLREFLPQMKLSLNAVTPVLKVAINTFSFTATNIVLRPGQWNVVTLLLLKVLGKREEEVRLALESDEATSIYEQFIDDNVDFLVEELIGNDYFTVD